MLVAFPIIIIDQFPLQLKSMAAPRTPWWKVLKLGTGIQDSPIVNVKNHHARTVNSLAPPTRHSLKCIQVYNFGLVAPNFTNEVPLESLDQDKFNAPYDVNLRRIGFSAILNFIKNLQKAFSGHLQTKPNKSYHVDLSLLFWIGLYYWSAMRWHLLYLMLYQ